jgi:large subunit ribosomal protein L3
MKAIIGKKIGMTQIFDETGRVVPVTVISTASCTVVRKRTMERDGYEAVQLGFDPMKEKHVRKPVMGMFRKAGIMPLRHLTEVRGTTELGEGAAVKPDLFAAGARVDVIGTSKGRGFQGVVKRHGFSGGPATHGSKTGRIPGSLGASAYPSRVIKGKKLPGQMGNKRVTTRNLVVVGFDMEQDLIWLRGAVPGSRNSVVLIREAIGGR